MNSIIYVGMDVHKNSYSLCSLNGETGEYFNEVKIASDIKLVEKYMNELKKSYTDFTIRTSYEAGCLGYSLYRQLKALGTECDIMAPTTMSRSVKNQIVKNDKLDARNIATNLQSGSYKAVYVPGEADVEVKEYIRMLEDFKQARKQMRQKVSALLLRHGQSYPGKSRWIPSHMKWLKEVELTEMYREILNEYISEIESLDTKIERFSERVKEMSQQETYEKPVGKLRCFKGVDTLAAMTLHVEVSDFNRFPNANAFMSFCGLTPGENSSGDKSHRTGITKQGNITVRTILTECANALVRGSGNTKSKALKARQKGQEVQVIDYADRAVERLQKKFRRMMYRGVNRNIAITAVARELAGFIWGMETGNIK